MNIEEFLNKYDGVIIEKNNKDLLTDLNLLNKKEKVIKKKKEYNITEYIDYETFIKSDAGKVLLNEINEDEYFDEIFSETFDDIIEYIKECGDSKESLDTYYINTEYSYKIDKYMFIVYGSEYHKDGGTCPEEMSNVITVKYLI
jgi:hypothetical protein